MGEKYTVYIPLGDVLLWGVSVGGLGALERCASLGCLPIAR